MKLKSTETVTIHLLIYGFNLIARVNYLETTCIVYNLVIRVHALCR